MIDLSHGASSGRRVLLYSNDTQGNGHLRQSLQLADRLTSVPGVASVLIAASAPTPLESRHPAGVDLITLPAAVETGATYRSQTLGVSMEALVRFRGNVLGTVVDSYQPDLILVDDVPVGFEAELWPVLRRMSETRSRPRLLLGLRDVIDTADRVYDEWSRLDAWRVVDRFYDRVLVYGDDAVTTTASELRLPARLNGRVRHVGYLGRVLPKPDPDTVDGPPTVLLLTGDDPASELVLDSYARLLASTPSLAPFRSVELRQGDATTADMMARAAAVVAVADYPTVCDVLTAGVPALLVPRQSPCQEQVLRAERLAVAGGIDTVAATELTAERLRDFVAYALTRSLDGRLADTRVAVDGMDRVAEEVGALLGHAGTIGVAPPVEAPTAIRVLPSKPKPAPTGSHRVGYVLSRLPRATDTAIVHEMVGLEGAGIGVRVLALRSSDDDDQARPPGLERLSAPATVIEEGTRSSLRVLFEELDRRAGPDGARQARALLHRLPGPMGVRILDQALQLAEKVRAEGLQHLHTHFMEDAAVTTFVAHVVCGVPFSVTVHGADVFRHNVDRDAFAEVASSASAVVAECEAVKRHVIDELLLGRDARVEVVHGVAVVDEVTTSESNRIGGFVLAVGRLEEKKGFRLLVEACTRLLQDGVDVGCAIVGEGAERDHLAMRIRAAEIGDRVRLAGALPHSQVLDLMRKAMVVVAPSINAADGDRDALPTVLLEAMACGTPVVTTPVGGIGELVDDGVDGILVPAQDAGSLATAIRVLLQERDTWSRLSEAAVGKIRRQFDGPSSVRRLASILGYDAACART